MFIELVLRKRVAVHPKQTDMREEVMRKLREGLAGEKLDRETVALFPTRLTDVSDIDVHEGLLYPLATCHLVAYRLYEREVLWCSVEKQEKAGIVLAHAFFPSIRVPPALLPQPSEFSLLETKAGQAIEMWCWKYRDAKLYVRTGDACRVRIVKSKGPGILASIAESGLGPTRWW